ncbi:MAG: tetratricopeptide repeat protein [Nitrospinaceae bacterium]
MALSLVILIMACLACALYFGVLGKSPTKEKSGKDKDPPDFKADAGTGKAANPAKNIFQKMEVISEKKTMAKLKALSLFQVAPPPEKFFGRKGVLISLLEKNKEGTPALGLTGLPGCGKTVTACKLIEKLIAKYPQAQIYFNFQWIKNPDRAVHEAMGHVITSFKPETPLPGSPLERSELYHAALKGQSAILFFDNVAKLQHLQELAPPETCLLVVTSSTRLHLKGVAWEPLEELPPEDLREMMVHWCHRIGFWAAELTKYCGANPLAASLTSNYLAEFSQLDPAVWMSNLRDQFNTLKQSQPDTNQAGIQATLQMIHASLPPPLLKLMARLLLFPSAFDVDSESFIGEDKEGVNLELLTRTGLVEFNEQTGRYHIPLPVQSWWKTRTIPSQLGLAETRLAIYFMTLMQKIRDLHATGEPLKQSQAMGLFDLEWDNIQKGQAWAQANCLKDQDTAKICQGYTEFGYSMLKIRQPSAVRLPWLEGGLLAAQTLQDEASELDCILQMGLELMEMKNHARAAEVLQKVLPLAEKRQNLRARFFALHGLGTAWAAQGNRDKALDWWLQEKDLAVEHNQPQHQLQAEEAVAGMYLRADDVAGAMEWLEKALATARDLDEKTAEHRLIATLGEAHLNAGDPQWVVNTFLDSLISSIPYDDQATRAGIFRCLGEAHHALNEPAKAAPFYEKSFQLYQQIPDALKQAQVLGRQGLCVILAGDAEAGTLLLNQAAAGFRKIKYAAGELDMWGQAAAVYLGLERVDQALKILRRQGALARKVRLPEWEARALSGLAAAAEKNEDPAEALSHLRAALKLVETIRPVEAQGLRQRIEKLEAAPAPKK